jgi:hypothetical protein
VRVIYRKIRVPDLTLFSALRYILQLLYFILHYSFFKFCCCLVDQYRNERTSPNLGISLILYGTFVLVLPEFYLRCSFNHKIRELSVCVVYIYIYIYIYIRVQLFHTSHVDTEGGWGIAPLILSPGARWTWGVKITLRPLCPLGIHFSTHESEHCVVLKAGLDVFGDEKFFCANGDSTCVTRCSLKIIVLWPIHFRCVFRLSMGIRRGCYAKQCTSTGVCNEDAICLCEVRTEFSSASFIDFVFHTVRVRQMICTVLTAGINGGI